MPQDIYVKDLLNLVERCASSNFVVIDVVCLCAPVQYCCMSSSSSSSISTSSSIVVVRHVLQLLQLQLLQLQP